MAVLRRVYVCTLSDPTPRPIRLGSLSQRSLNSPFAILRFQISNPLMWDFSTLADHVAAALQSAEDELRLEQAVYGLDARDERALQSLLADRLADHYQV